MATLSLDRVLRAGALATTAGVHDEYLGTFDVRVLTATKRERRAFDEDMLEFR
jgi:hypothetical protein